MENKPNHETRLSLYDVNTSARLTMESPSGDFEIRGKMSFKARYLPKYDVVDAHSPMPCYVEYNIKGNSKTGEMEIEGHSPGLRPQSDKLLIQVRDTAPGKIYKSGQTQMSISTAIETQINRELNGIVREHAPSFEEVKFQQIEGARDMNTPLQRPVAKMLIMPKKDPGLSR